MSNKKEMAKFDVPALKKALEDTAAKFKDQFKATKEVQMLAGEKRTTLQHLNSTKGKEMYEAFKTAVNAQMADITLKGKPVWQAKNEEEMQLASMILLGPKGNAYRNTLYGPMSVMLTQIAKEQGMPNVWIECSNKVQESMGFLLAAEDYATTVPVYLDSKEVGEYGKHLTTLVNVSKIQPRTSVRKLNKDAKEAKDKYTFEPISEKAKKVYASIEKLVASPMSEKEQARNNILAVRMFNDENIVCSSDKFLETGFIKSFDAANRNSVQLAKDNEAKRIEEYRAKLKDICAGKVKPEKVAPLEAVFLEATAAALQADPESKNYPVAGMEALMKQKKVVSRKSIDTIVLKFSPAAHNYGKAWRKFADYTYERTDEKVRANYEKMEKKAAKALAGGR